MVFEEMYPWTTTTWRNKYDCLAPDGSEIRLRAEVPAGGLSHCTPRPSLTAGNHCARNSWPPVYC